MGPTLFEPSHGADVGCNQVFFAKVAKTATEGDIKLVFSAYGTVCDVILFEWSQGHARHRGCGLVTMGSWEEAAAAITGLNSQILWPGCNKPMTVTWMDPALQDRSQRIGVVKPDNPPPGCDPDAIKLFVGNIPLTYTEHDLLPILQTIGPVAKLGLIREGNNAFKGCAFLWYRTRLDAERAVAVLHLQHTLPDPTGQQLRPLVVRPNHKPADKRMTQAPGTFWPRTMQGIPAMQGKLMSAPRTAPGGPMPLLGQQAASMRAPLTSVHTTMLPEPLLPLPSLNAAQYSNAANTSSMVFVRLPDGNLCAVMGADQLVTQGSVGPARNSTAAMQPVLPPVSSLSAQQMMLTPNPLSTATEYVLLQPMAAQNYQWAST